MCKRIVETNDDNDGKLVDKPKKKILLETQPKYKGKPKQNVLSHHSEKRIEYYESSCKENFNCMKGSIRQIVRQIHESQYVE